MVSLFFALHNVRIIISVEYQFLNIFFSFCLILFAFNLAAVSLFLLFGTTRIYSHLLPDLKKKKKKKKKELYGSFEPHVITWFPIGSS